MKKSKRQKQIEKLCDFSKTFTVEEAVAVLKKAPPVKFNETVEVAIKLGIDPTQADQQVRGTVQLPNGTGKTVRVVVIAEGEDAKKAQDAGADFVGGTEIMDKIQQGWLDFDCVISVPPMMKNLSKLGKILGPRGLMPNPKAGTVTTDIPKAVKEMKAGKIEYRVNKASDMHVPIGKISFTNAAIAENIHALIQAIIKTKPPSAKGQYLKTISVSTTMGPGVRLNTDQFKI